MKLTSEEEKAISRLRLEGQIWSWYRWIRLALFLALATTVATTSVHMFRDILDNPLIAEPLTLGFTLVWPMLFIVGAIAVIIVIHTVIHWNGRTERKLLLRVIDELKEEESSQPAH